MGRWLRGSLVALAVLTLVITGCAGAKTPASEPGGKNSSVAVPAAPERKVTAAASSVAAIERRGELRILLDWTNPSFIRTGTEHPEEAFGVELSRRITEIIFGSKVKAVFVFSLVRERSLKEGNGDLLLDTWQPTGEELQTFHISPPYYTDSSRLLVGTAARISTIEELDGKTTAQIVNTSWEIAPDRLPGYLKQTRPSLNVDAKEFMFFQEGVQAVLARDVAAVSGPTSQLAGFVKDDSDVMLLPERYGTWTYGAVVLKQNGELAAAVDKAIQQMKESGELDQLIKKWGLDI